MILAHNWPKTERSCKKDRVKIVEGRNPSRENAKAMENVLLNRYDYAWKTRINVQIRYILPWCQRLLNKQQDRDIIVLTELDKLIFAWY